MSHPKRIAALSCLAIGLAWMGGVQAAPVRIVILAGQEVHDWKATTPFLEAMYNGDPKRFTVVEVVEDVAAITDATFAKCDVIVSNWTSFPVMIDGPWTPEGKKAFTDAISNGKGMVSFHAASTCCHDWPEFQEISGLTWKLEHTGHTKYHTFKVSVSDKKHAITSGLSDFWITDELYQRMVKLTESEFRTLARAFANIEMDGTGESEPMLIITKLGKGRGVNFLLGHDVHAMRNTAWQTIMLRSTEWAATGRVTVPVPQEWPSTPAAAAVVGVDADAVIEAAAQYVRGQNREALYAVERLVDHSTSRTAKTAAEDRTALAGKLGQAIGACKTSEAKAFFCSQLALIGTSQQVPVIAPLLGDEQAAMMARQALERIAGPAAAAALRDALGELSGELRIGAINSLGNRVEVEPESVAALAPLLGDAEPGTAMASASALGRMGTVEAAETLKAARSTAKEAVRLAITDACLACGDRLIARGDRKNAAGIYKLLYAPAEPPSIRAAALRGQIMSQPTQATALINEAIDSGVPELAVAVANIVREQPKVGDTRVIAGAALRLEPGLQAMMIQSLADRGEKAAVNTARRGLEHDNQAVRLASIAALGRLGDELDVALLAGVVESGNEAERTAAMESLQRLPSPAGGIIPSTPNSR